MKPIKNSYLTEININATPGVGQKYYFTDYAQLRNMKAIGVEAVTSSQLASSPTGKTMIAEGDLPSIVLVLTDKNSTAKTYQIPLNTIYPASNGGIIRSLDDLELDLTKSYIQLVGTAMSANESVCFNWYY